MSSSQQLLLGEGAGGAAPVYIEDVFSCFLYTGNGSTQTITNGIDLSTKGGLVWAKSRSNVIRNSLFDTARGANFQLSSNTTESSANVAPNGITFDSTGFTTGSFVNTNTNAATYVSWTFRKQPKFFDIVTYTGNGTSQTISHNLGSTPGCILVKSTSATSNWIVYHIGLSSPNSIHLKLNSSNGQDGNNQMVNGTSSTTFSVGSETAVNDSGGTYVAYIFAHNAGGFGLLGTDNVISCGSFSVDGAASFSVNLGYEPQWVMIKSVDNTSVSAIRQNWIIYDTMRNLQVQTQGQSARLLPNSDAAESSSNEIGPTATGFESIGNQNPSTGPYIYVAIRRGPMKVPTSGTSVFAMATAVGTEPAFVSNAVVDMGFNVAKNAGSTFFNQSRLMGAVYLNTRATAAEVSESSRVWDYMNGMLDGQSPTTNNVGYMFGRAPGFFDSVCWISTGSFPQVLNHNLTVAPELIIRKPRSIADEWAVGFDFQTSSYKKMALNTTAAQTSYGSYSSGEFPGKPTATQFTDQGSAASRTFVAYLFATCAGVSKVGSYTGNATLTTIDCGFTGGAKFVLIKIINTTGNWFLWDTTRGMVASNDPSLTFNSAAAEDPGDSVYTIATGFQLVASPSYPVNSNGYNYIFLAFA